MVLYNCKAGIGFVLFVYQAYPEPEPPEYSRERGGTEDPSRTNTNSELNKVLGRGLVGAGWV